MTPWRLVPLPRAGRGRCRAGRRRGSWSGPSGRTRRGGSRGRAPRPSRPRTRRAGRSARPARCLGEGRRYWPRVRMSTPISRSSPRTARISSGLLAEAEHEAGLRDRAAPLRVPQHRVRAGVARLHPDLARQAGDRLEVVREHVGPGGEHGVDGAGVPLEIAGQHLEHQLGAPPLDRADGRRPVRGAAVGQIVPVDAGDHRVPQPQLGEHRGDVRRAPRDRPAADARSARRRTGRTGCRSRRGS